MPLSPETLKAMKEAAEKATPGPWTADEIVPLHDGLYEWFEITGPNDQMIAEIDSDYATRFRANAAFIAVCNPANVAALIAEVERQAGEIKRLREDFRILTKGRFTQS